jgi:hypothetical protein
VVAVVVVLLGVMAWLDDFITLNGTGRTVYTAECSGGSWQGRTCTGRLVAGDRHRFRALKNHREVLYWTAGSPLPSGKMTDCTITDARDWTCREAPSQPPPLTMTMANGRAVAAPGRALTHHCVEKWKWLLLSSGVTWIHDANT